MNIFESLLLKTLPVSQQTPPDIGEVRSALARGSNVPDWWFCHIQIRRYLLDRLRKEDALWERSYCLHFEDNDLRGEGTRGYHDWVSVPELLVGHTLERITPNVAQFDPVDIYEEPIVRLFFHMRGGAVFVAHCAEHSELSTHMLHGLFDLPYPLRITSAYITPATTVSDWDGNSMCNVTLRICVADNPSLLFTWHTTGPPGHTMYLKECLQINRVVFGDPWPGFKR